MSAQTPEDQYIKVGDINTRFWTSGDEGTAVILVHGIGDAIETWESNINVLGEHHRVYALDLVGFGRSDKPLIQPSLPFGAQFVSDFMETQRIERASLVGNSMGGAISLQFALQFPDKVEKLVVEDGAALGKGIATFFRVFSIPLIGELMSRPSRWGTAWLLKQIAYDPAVITDEMVELYYGLASLPRAQKSFLTTLRVGVNFLGQRPQFVSSIVDNLGKITCPTLIIWGQQDRILPAEHSQVAKNGIPNAELQILDPCGHGPHFERPDDYNKLLLEFLGR
ncbi:MAG TPA: alpha/beta fold hydrolase [Dehalococcoidia bacterium]|nr:alpha/beta fold hydrolase [Dehalococcoidia bacterium]